MTDWSAALAHAFRRHLADVEYGERRASPIGPSADAARHGARGTTRTTRPNVVVPRVVPVKPAEPLGFDEPGTTGTTGTTHSDAVLQTPAEDDQAALFDERAAIVQDGAGMPRDWAEAFARVDLLAGWHHPEDRWHQLIDDAGRFLDRFGNEAARLGWSAVDVFGMKDPSGITSMPAGLVPLISGGMVESIGSDRATIRMSDGGIVVYLRRPRPGLSSDWERADGAARPPGGRQ